MNKEHIENFFKHLEKNIGTIEGNRIGPEILHGLLVDTPDFVFEKMVWTPYQEAKRQILKGSSSLEKRRKHKGINEKESLEETDISVFNLTYHAEQNDFDFYIRALLEEWKNEWVRYGGDEAEFIEQFGVNDVHDTIQQMRENDPTNQFKWENGIRYKDDLIEMMDESLARNNNLLMMLNESLRHVYNRFYDNGWLKQSKAQQFVQAQQADDDLSQFISDKHLEQNKTHHFKMSKSQSFQQVMRFDDESLALMNKDGKWVSPDFDYKTYKTIAPQIAHQYIDYAFRKKPKYQEPFHQMFENNQNNSGEMVETAHKILEKEPMLKAIYDDFCKEVVAPKKRSKNHSYESISDEIDEQLYRHKIKQLAHSIISSKYQHLLDEESYEHFEQLYNLNLSRQQLEENIGVKLAGFEGPSDLNKALKRYYNSLNEFDAESYLEKMVNLNAEVVKNEDNILIAKINDFQASEILGTSLWCISTNSRYFSNYTGDDGDQFFIYDFNKSTYDNDSMIGITLANNGEAIYAMHYKNDRRVMEDDVMEYWQQEVINNYEKYQQDAPTATPKTKPTL